VEKTLNGIAYDPDYDRLFVTGKKPIAPVKHPQGRRREAETQAH
jgi:Glutamine cyclotransferase